ncbi:MAG: hypothetical protein CO094_02990 [Anaerolineae bacterium CG_4_9_14_3_um_filter_57_17]|nr:MAG: hypothetical protein AUK01_11665 [Anaerolineae bacterium CG2_30_57_67]PJB67790.1 MAG: hypothetical protein CO094_02990 [Anaerolineae bacterium CG_4_9_14_3_um_filter_57_17]
MRFLSRENKLAASFQKKNCEWTSVRSGQELYPFHLWRYRSEAGKCVFRDVEIKIKSQISFKKMVFWYLLKILLANL